MRNRLPYRRHSFNFTFHFGGEQYDVTCGLYPDNTIGELFINRLITRTSAKVGTLLDGVCRDAALLTSLALQHGADLDNIRHAITRDDDGDPSTIIGAIIDHLHKNGTPYDGNNRRSPPAPSEPNPTNRPPTPTGGSTEAAAGNSYTIHPVDLESAIRLDTGSLGSGQDPVDSHSGEGGD